MSPLLLLLHILLCICSVSAVGTTPLHTRRQRQRSALPWTQNDSSAKLQLKRLDILSYDIHQRVSSYIEDQGVMYLWIQQHFNEKRNSELMKLRQMAGSAYRMKMRPSQVYPTLKLTNNNNNKYNNI